ncbi:MAG: citrate synthase, partial [Ignavibacteriae bacterium]|nr:citrate synthase [Ignavibacteriota bacterium]
MPNTSLTTATEKKEKVAHPVDGKNTLAITDNRTGKQYEIPIEHDTIRAMDLRQIKVRDDDFGMMTYDPAFMNTASCKSKIAFIDGDKGILRYRGYPIEHLAEKSNYLEIAYLIINGELPTKSQYEEWVDNIMNHTLIHENIKKFIDGFHYDAHPMGMLISAVAALSTFYPDAKYITESQSRKLQIIRLVGKMPTLAAFAFRHSVGRPYVYPDNELSYAGNFLSMLFKMTEVRYKINPVLERALDVLFILHADHEQNCSTSTVRLVGSSRSNLFACIAAGIGALWGPWHGGANQEVVEMLEQIHQTGGDTQKYIAMAKDPNSNFRLSGFGHRVYKTFDPRAKVIKAACDRFLGKKGVLDPLLEIALKLEEVALKDELFISRKLYPN